MKRTQEVEYRVNLAEGYLREAREDLAAKRWRACVSDSQLAVENAAKAALALLGPVGRTHNPAALLVTALAENRFPPSVRERVQQLAEYARELGPDVHIKSDYGDENQWQTPWQLFGQADAEHALDLAEKAVGLAKQLLKAGEQ
jgi:HEPN domain-containing protein